MNPLRTTLILATLLFTAACAGVKVDRQTYLQKNRQLISDFIVAQQLQSRSVVNPFRYHGWQSIDEQHLILNASLTRAYLVVLTSQCHDLRYAQLIKVKTSGIGLNAKFDTIRAMPDGRIDCRIDEIYPISREQLNQLKTKLEAENPR